MRIIIIAFSTILLQGNTSKKIQLASVQAKYRYEFSKLQQDSSVSPVDIPVNVSFDFQLVTNGRYYYITPSLNEILVFKRGMPVNATEDDVFVDSKNKYIYFLGRHTYSRYLQSTLITQQKGRNLYYAVSNVGDTVEFKTDPKLKNFVKPFPSYPLLSYGIVESTKKNAKWTLYDTKLINFDYSPILTTIKSFSFDTSIYRFPYL